MTCISTLRGAAITKNLTGLFGIASSTLPPPKEENFQDELNLFYKQSKMGNRLKISNKYRIVFYIFFIFSNSHATVGLNCSSNQTDSIPQKIIGNDFPEFTLTNTMGDIISNQNLKGKITVINFWFEACAPCIMELDALNNLVLKFENNPDFQFLSFTIDSPETAKQAIKKLGITYDLYPITREESMQLFCTSFPTSLIINQQGKVVYMKAGLSPNNMHIQQMELLTAFLLLKNNINSPHSYSVSASVLTDSLINSKMVDVAAIVLKKLEEKRIAAIGSKYFDFDVATIQEKRISDNNLQGKITVIDFWIESCSPCMGLFDFFNNLYLHYIDNPAFQFISFTFDSEENAKKIVDKHNLLFDVVCVEREDIYRLNYNTGFPTVLIIDSNGIVSYFTNGITEKEKNVMKNNIDNLLVEFPKAK